MRAFEKNALLAVLIRITDTRMGQCDRRCGKRWADEALAQPTALDQLRDMLMLTYADEIRTMLQEAITTREIGSAEEDGEPF